MTFKTLKDLFLSPYTNKVLKKEAIKWVKFCEKKYKNKRYEQVFKEFFNLKEEDLK